MYTIKGLTFTRAKFDSLTRRVEHIADHITATAIFAAACAVVHNDKQTLNAYINLRAFKKADGKHNVLGGKVVSYIRAHCATFLTYDAKSMNFDFRKFTGKEKAELKAKARGFTCPETGEVTQRVENEVTPENIDWMHFSTWLEYKKPTAAVESKPVSVAAVQKQAAKQLEAIKQQGIAGTAKEVEEAMSVLIDVMTYLTELGSLEREKEEKEKQAVDAEKVLQSVSVQPSTKAKAAPKKRAASA